MSTSEKFPKSKGPQVKRSPSQKVPKSKGSQVKRSPSQKVPKSKGPQVKGALVKKSTKSNLIIIITQGSKCWVPGFPQALNIFHGNSTLHLEFPAGNPAKTAGNLSYGWGIKV